MTTAVTKVDEFKVDLVKNYQKSIENYFASDKLGAMKFISSVVNAVQQNKNLLNCSRDSLFSAFMKIAELGLIPSTVAGEAYMIPYGNVAQFQLGYKGIVKLLARSGVIVTRANIIKEKDTYEIEDGTGSYIKHTIPMLGDRGDAIAAYVVVKFKGETIFKWMRKDEILKFKTFSKTAGKDSSPWDIANDPELWMWLKTVIKQLSKTLPLNEEISIAIAEDNKD